MEELTFDKELGDSEIVKKAYDFGSKAHSGQLRASGEPYFTHCVETAKILKELKLDNNTIAAALLHDVLEDTSVTYNDLKREFGKSVADMVEGVTKINILGKKTLRTNNIETIRKMLMSASNDIRVMLIKIADRLHNMRTIDRLENERRRKFSRTTLDIYATLAYRLGLISIKCELEDLAFRTLEPEIYNDFKQKVSKTKKMREKEINNIIKDLDKELKKHNLDVKVYGRPKHFYSIYRKMKLKNVDFNRVYDLIGLRVITKTVEECYEVLGVIHNFYQPINNRLKDYIANPKPNFYQSLHTGVVTDVGQVIEVQMRTKEMDEIADEGVAAHWRYKGSSGDKFDKSLSWLKQILDFSNDHPSKFMRTLKVDLFGDNIFVFTPKGDVIELPSKATPVDFAYAVHSDVGEKCSGSRVNGRFVSLRYELHTGDVIEILTSKSHRPSRDWLKFVRSSKALNKIRNSLKMYQGIPAKNVKIIRKEDVISNDILYVEGLKGFDVKFSACCDPLPGDRVLGYVNKMKNKVTVHTYNCKSLGKIKKELVVMQWMKNFNKELKLNIYALDRVGLFADVLNTVSSTGTNISLAKAKSIDDFHAECILNIKFDGIEHLREIIERIHKIADVKRVRIE